MEKLKTGRLNFFNGGWIAYSALACASIGQILIYYYRYVFAGLLFFALAIAVFVIADKINKKNTRNNDGFFPRLVNIPISAELIILLLITVLAAFMRLYRLDTTPAGCYYDEALGGISALDLLNGSPLPVNISGDNGVTTTVFNGFPGVTNMSIYYIAVAFKFFGAGALQMRAASALAGILAVPALYFLFRCLAGPVPALTGAYILAIMRWHIIFSRVAFNAVEAVLLVIFVIYFGVKAYSGRKTFDFVLLGLTAAVSLYSYQNTRLVPVFIAVCAAFLFLYDRGFLKANWRNAVVSACVFLIVFLPLGIYVAKNFNSYIKRQDEVSIFSKASKVIWSADRRQTIEDRRYNLQILLSNIRDTMLMFNLKGDSNYRHNLPGWPELDLITGMFALAGFGYALTRICNPVYFLFIAGFFIFMSAGFFTIGAPQSLRTTLAIPPVIFFMLVFIGRFISSFDAKGKAKYIAASVIGLLLLLSCYENFYTYFLMQARDVKCCQGFSTAEYLAGKKAKEARDAGARVLVSPRFQHHPSFIFADNLSRDCAAFDLSTCFEGFKSSRGDTMLILPEQYKHFADYLKGLYPQISVKYAWDEYVRVPLFIYCAVPAKGLAEFKKAAPSKGAKVEYFNSRGFTGRSIKQKVPVIMLTAYENPGFDILSATWSAILDAPVSGKYYFNMRSKGGACFYIDKKQLFCSPETSQEFGAVADARVFLARGKHAVEVKYESVASSVYGSNGLWLFWQRPGEKEMGLVAGE